MTIAERVKTMLQNWLQIQPAALRGVTIREALPLETDIMRSQVWRRGEAAELEQFFKQLCDGVGQARFWAAVPEHQSIRKIHSGLPGMMVSTLAYIVKADLGEVEFEEGDPGAALWGQLLTDLDFPRLVGGAVADTLTAGDGAFKISIDPSVSPWPLAEFWDGSRVRFETRRGRVTAVQFWSTRSCGKKAYRLCEAYGAGFVRYSLWDGDKEVPLGTVPELAGLAPVECGGLMLAVPFRIYDSTRYPGRGRSIFEGKTEVFDAHDEVISQWMDAVRAGRVQKYIPEDLMPRDKEGKLYCPDSFGTSFIQLGSSVKEDAKAGQIQVVQPPIGYDAYLSTYRATLDMCLQGVMSPATLGIDVGKMSSAEAQREKKDITGHTRNAITAALERALPKLVTALLHTCDLMAERPQGDYLPRVTFGEYGAPDFDSRVETVARAAVGGVMSVEAQVEELWGGSKDKAWLNAEVQRIKAEKGLSAEEPALGPQAPNTAVTAGW